jgi:hypothetical protein
VNPANFVQTAFSRKWLCGMVRTSQPISRRSKSGRRRSSSPMLSGRSAGRPAPMEEASEEARKRAIYYPHPDDLPGY